MCLQKHLRMFLQGLQAHCLAPGRSGSILQYLEALVRLPGASGRIACCFRTDIHVTDVTIHLEAENMPVWEFKLRPQLSEYEDMHFQVVLAMVLHCHFGSGSRSEPYDCQIGGPGCQHTRTFISGMVQYYSPNPSGLGGLSADPSVDLYNVLVFVVG
jgi:hypothetical protein